MPEYIFLENVLLPGGIIKILTSGYQKRDLNQFNPMLTPFSSPYDGNSAVINIFATVVEIKITINSTKE
ncbi:hypothetical protein [Cronobacter sp. EKM101R]|uniref:hypothetical protein n=1 Tax=Cronobacter TaxID=413496 RepID=UPI001C88C9D9|nr:hypothetical protein [Cronobacter sp. EKM101R]